MQTVVTLAPGEKTEVIILLGAAPGEDAARALIERYRAGTAAADALAAAASAWDRRLATVSVWTPSPEFDATVNRLIRALGGPPRMWARSAVYQSSSTYRFATAAADGMSFVYAEPGVTRAHLIVAASASSSRATCSTGGIPRAAAASAPASPTTSRGSPSASTTTSAGHRRPRRARRDGALPPHAPPGARPMSR